MFILTVVQNESTKSVAILQKWLL